MGHSTGVSADTPKRAIYGAGVWVKNYDPTLTLAAQAANIIGATAGGNTLELHQKRVGVEYDDAPGPVKGAQRIVEDYATGVGTFKDVSLASLLLQLPGAEAVTVGDVATITRSREIAAADYIGNIALVCDHATEDGSIGFILYDVLGGSDVLSVKPVSKEAASLEMTFTSHYDPADMDTRPWAILWPAGDGLAAADTTAPNIASVSPANGATAVAKAGTTLVVWTFDNAVRPNDVNAANFNVCSVAGVEKAGTLALSGSDKIVTFTPSTAWAATTVYVAVAENVRNVSGLPMTARKVSSFTTGA